MIILVLYCTHTLIELLLTWPDLQPIIDLILEFIQLCNKYISLPYPGNKLNTKWWLELLNSLPSGPANELLINGIKHGVRLGFASHKPPLVRIPTNIISSLTELEQMLKILMKDIKRRNKQPVSWHPSYINCIWMRDEIKKYRLITHASKCIKGFGSINSIIKDEFKPVYLWNLKTLCQWLYLHGNKSGLYITTYDLEDYFHHFRIHPDDRKYVGYMVFGKKLISLYTPYGLASVPRIACTHSDISTIAYHRLMDRASQDTQRFYVDDSTVIHYDWWQLHLNSLTALKVSRDAGFIEGPKKRTWCCQLNKIYGWIFDTQYTPILIYLPFKRRVKLRKLLDIMLSVSYGDIAFMFKLCGCIMNYCQINKILKILCIKWIKLIYANIDSDLSIKSQMNKIIHWPSWFINRFKIWYYIIYEYHTFSINNILCEYINPIYIAVDATLISYGIYCNGQYISDILPKFMLGLPIHLCEAYAVLQAIYIFQKIILSHHVIIYCDNEPACKVFQRYWSKNITWEPYLYQRSLFMVQLDCIIDVIHVAGECNVFADALSRGKMGTFKQLCITHKRPYYQRIYPTHLLLPLHTT